MIYFCKFKRWENIMFGKIDWGFWVVSSLVGD